MPLPPLLPPLEMQHFEYTMVLQPSSSSSLSSSSSSSSCSSSDSQPLIYSPSQLSSVLKSCIYLLGGVILLGFLHFSPFILSTIASLIVLTGYVYTTLGLTFLIGYHVYMLLTYMKHYGTQWVKKVLNYFKTKSFLKNFR